MPLAAPVLAGLEEYRRGDFIRAAREWERAGAELEEPAECDLLIALGRLATALETHRRHETDTAALVFAEAEAALSGLPDAVLGVDVLALRAELARGLGVVAAAPPQPVAVQRFPLGSTLRFLSLFVVLGAVAALLRFTPLGQILDRHRVVAFFLGLRQSTWAPLVLLGLYMVLAPLGLPMTPLIIAGGVVFGRTWGAVYNILGCLLGAAISYQVGKLLGRDFVRRLGRKRLKRIEILLRRRGFWSLVGVRYLPIPFSVVNYGAAMAGLPFSTFLLTTLIGLIPALSVYSYFAAAIFDVTQGGDPAQLRSGIIALLAVMALSLTPTIVQQVRRRRRYRRLLIERHARRLRPHNG